MSAPCPILTRWPVDGWREDITNEHVEQAIERVLCEERGAPSTVIVWRVPTVLGHSPNTVRGVDVLNFLEYLVAQGRLRMGETFYQLPAEARR